MPEDTSPVDRRTILKTTGVGAGLALTAGAGQSQTQVQSNSTHGVVSDLDGTLFPDGSNELFLTVDASNPRADTLVFTADEVTFQGELYDDGTWESTSVTVPDNAFSIVDDDIAGVIEGFDIPGIIEGLDLNGLASLIATAVDAMDLDASQRRVPVDTLSAVIDEFNVSLAGRDKQEVLDIVDRFFENPTADDILAAIDLVEDGLGVTINEPEDILRLLGTDDPEGVEDILTQVVQTLPRLLFNTDLADLSLEVPKIGGEFEPNGVVTVEPETIDVEVSAGQFEIISTTLDTGAPAGVTPTTDQSGELVGRQTELTSKNGDASLTASVVENEFTLNLEAVDLVAVLENLNLPSLLLNLAGALAARLQIDLDQIVLEEGDLINEVINPLLAIFGFPNGLDEAVIQLVDDAVEELNADVSGVTLQDIRDLGNIQGALEDLDIPAIAESVGLLGLILGFFRDESGRHAIGFDVDLTADEGSVESEFDPVESVGSGNNLAPRDLNDDGLLEDVRGIGNVTALDVQVLFNNLETDTIQNNSEEFNFQGFRPDLVSVIDVQALWNQQVNQNS